MVEGKILFFFMVEGKNCASTSCLGENTCFWSMVEKRMLLDHGRENVIFLVHGRMEIFVFFSLQDDFFFLVDGGEKWLLFMVGGENYVTSHGRENPVVVFSW